MIQRLIDTLIILIVKLDNIERHLEFIETQILQKRSKENG